MRKKHRSLFASRSVGSSENLKALNTLMQDTSEYMEAHNAVVTRLWEVQHKIARYKSLMGAGAENAGFQADLGALQEDSDKLQHALDENGSPDIIRVQLREIERQMTLLFPEEKFDLDSPFDLKNGFS